MSRFFNMSSDNQNTNDMNNMGQFQQPQGVITPGLSNNMNEQEAQTFVVDSYDKNVLNNINNGFNNQNVTYYPNNNEPMNAGMNQQVNMMNSNMQLQNGNMQQNVVGNEILEMPNMNSEINNNVVRTDEFNNPISLEMNDIEEEIPKDLKTNVFVVVGMMIGMVFSPGTTIINNSKKYKDVGKSLTITLWITVLSLLLCVGSRIIFGAFVKNYNAVTGFSSISFNLSNVMNLSNYIEYLIITFIVSFGTIIITSLCYYASSFINSKGVHMGTYFMVSNLAVVPLIVGVLVLYPGLSLISDDLGLIGLLFAFLYTIVSFLIGISEVLKFKSINNKVLYNVLNLTVIITIMYLLLSLLMRLNIITIMEFNF